jgi:hypothetical protein
MYFYGDRGDGTIEELVNIGAGSAVIATFGTSASSRIPIVAKVKSGFIFSGSNYTGGNGIAIDVQSDNYYLLTSVGVNILVCTVSGGASSSSPTLWGTNTQIGSINHPDGDITLVTGHRLYLYSSNNAGHTISNMIGVHIYPWLTDGTVSNFKGIYLQAREAGATVTSYYGIYQEDAAAKNYFAGYTLAKGGIRVGTTDTDPGDNNLYVEGTTYLGGNITTGGTLGLTGTRVSYGYFTDLAVTNKITGSISGNCDGNAATAGHCTDSGSVLQVVSYTTSTGASGSTTIAVDFSKPQYNEGTQVLSLAIDPASASNYLIVDVELFINTGASPDWVTAALFQDPSAGSPDAECTITRRTDQANTQLTSLRIHYVATAGTASSTTFTVRVGSHGGYTWYLNKWYNESGTQIFNGAIQSSITITEVKA